MTKLFCVPILIYFCLLSISVHAQKATSTATDCAELCRQMKSNGSLNQIKLIEQIEILGKCLSERQQNDTIFYEYLNLKTTYFLRQNMLDSVEIYFQKSIALNDKLNDKDIQLSIEFTRGLVFQKRKQIVEAIKLYQKILPAVHNSKNKVMESQLLHNLATVYIDLHQYEASISYIEKAQRLILESTDFLSQGKISMQLADLCLQTKRFEQAEQAAKQAQQAFRKAKLKDYTRAATIRMAFAQKKQGMVMSLFFLDTLIAYLPDIRTGISGKITKSTAYVELANLLILSKHQLVLAEQLLQEAYPICEDLKLSTNMSNIFYAYAKLYNLKKSYDKAEEYYEKYIILKDSTVQNGSRLQLNGLKILHDVEQQDYQIQSLEQQQQVSNLSIIILVISLVFLAILAVFIRILLQQKIKIAQKKIVEQSNTIENQMLSNSQLETENDKLESENDAKTRVLATSTLHIIQKNELIKQLNHEISPLLRESELSDELKKQLTIIRGNIRDNDFFETSWDNFRQHFEQVHPSFFDNIKQKFPHLTPNDLRHCAYIRMGLSRKEIAMLMNTSIDAVKMARNRLKKKLLLKAEDEIITILTNV